MKVLRESVRPRDQLSGGRSSHRALWRGPTDPCDGRYVPNVFICISYVPNAYICISYVPNIYICISYVPNVYICICFTKKWKRIKRYRSFRPFRLIFGGRAWSCVTNTVVAQKSECSGLWNLFLAYGNISGSISSDRQNVSRAWSN